MTWHENCYDFDSRIEASADDVNFNDTIFLLTQSDADNPSGDQVAANKAILALISPVFYAQFYRPLASHNGDPIEIVDGTAQGFKRFIKFIFNPKSFKFEVQNVAEVFDISYFAHKYQIGSLVSHCRQFLGNYNVYGIELDTLNWAVSSERGLELKETFPIEHVLLVNNCLEYIQSDFNFRHIFPDGKLKEGQDLLDENVMIKILKSTTSSVCQEIVLSVAIDFYHKMIKNQKIVKGQKRLKIDHENEWDHGLEKIKSVVQFEKCHPGKLAEVYEKFFNKIPDKVIGKITMEISSTWKNKNTFNGTPPMNTDCELGVNFQMATRGNPDNDFIHNKDLKSGVQIKLKMNQNAVLVVDPSDLVICPCGISDECIEDFFIVQTDDDKEVVILDRHAIDYIYFYVKENKEVILGFERKCNRKECSLHLVRMNKFHFSKGNFKVDILEVNGEPVTSPCYTFLRNIKFIPS